MLLTGCSSSSDTQEPKGIAAIPTSSETPKPSKTEKPTKTEKPSSEPKATESKVPAKVEVKEEKAPAPAIAPAPVEKQQLPPAKAPAEAPAAGLEDGPGPYFKSCADAKKAGYRAMRSGQPGYSLNLDRDRDGIACEK